MTPRVKQVLKGLGILVLFCFSAFLILGSGRIIGNFLFFVWFVALISFSLHKGRRFLYTAWVLFFVAMLIPVDIRFGHVPGQSRILPVFYGLPTEEEELRSDQDWEGCVMPVLPLKWVVFL